MNPTPNQECDCGCHKSADAKDFVNGCDLCYSESEYNPRHRPEGESREVCGKQFCEKPSASNGWAYSTMQCTNLTPCKDHSAPTESREEALWCDGGKDCRCICHQTDYPLPADFPAPTTEWEKELNEFYRHHFGKDTYPPLEALVAHLLSQATQEARKECKRVKAEDVNYFKTFWENEARQTLLAEIKEKVEKLPTRGYKQAYLIRSQVLALLKESPKENN